MTDWQIVIGGLLVIIAIFSGLCAWGVWLSIIVHKANRRDREDG